MTPGPRTSILRYAPPSTLRAVLEEGNTISEKQLGRKIGRHAADFGLDPANPAHRAQLRHLIEEVTTSPDRVVDGTFRGQGVVKFLSKGEDVVVATPTDNFVTILQGGIHYIITRGQVVWSGTSQELRADAPLRRRYLGV